MHGALDYLEGVAKRPSEPIVHRLRADRSRRALPQRDPRYRAEQAQEKLTRLIDGKVNALVCGGNQELRRSAIGLATVEARSQNRFLTPEAVPGVDLVLEALPKEAQGFVVVFHDAQRIPNSIQWAIRSVAQTQHNNVYIFEGAHRGKMIDMVARYHAAFYQQLNVVDLDAPRRRASRGGSTT